MRALIVTNMYPTPENPVLGRFVRDQVEALRRAGDWEVEVFRVGAGSARAYAAAARRLATRRSSFDVVHAHFGLSAWPALAVRGVPHVLTLHGTDLAHPRTRPITLAATPWLDLVATVSQPLAAALPRWVPERKRAVLPCGVDLTRFVAIPRAQARARLGLDPAARYLLFPADPGRPEKRHDRAAALAKGAGVQLLVLGKVPPEEVPWWVNAADAVAVTSEREGFGLATLEALACGVPVLSTPVGVAPEVLAGVPGTLCAPFALEAWRETLEGMLADPDPRVEGRSAVAGLSTDAMAERVLERWVKLAG